MAARHEHVFHEHDDPRYLVCDCGQHAVLRRAPQGGTSVRLVDPPRRSFGDAQPTAPSRRRAPGLPVG
jgi:hypothetical protein